MCVYLVLIADCCFYIWWVETFEICIKEICCWLKEEYHFNRLQFVSVSFFEQARDEINNLLQVTSWAWKLLQFQMDLMIWAMVFSGFWSFCWLIDTMILLNTSICIIWLLMLVTIRFSKQWLGFCYFQLPLDCCGCLNCFHKILNWHQTTEENHWNLCIIFTFIKMVY